MTDDTGALSVDAAVGLLDAETEAVETTHETEKPKSKPAAAKPAATPEAGTTEEPAVTEETTEETAAAAETETEAETEEAGAESEAVATSARTPLSHWNASEREAFAKLPVEAQDVLLAQDGKREEQFKKSRGGLDTAKAAFDARVEALNQVLPAAAAIFKSKWDGIDWTTLPDRVGGDEAFKLKAQYDEEQRQLGRLAFEARQAEEVQYTEFVKTEGEALKTRVPDLVDAAKGEERRTAMGKFLVSEGYSSEQIRLMTARDASIAYDAMRWREAQSKAKALASAPKQPAPVVRTTVKPTASGQGRSPQSARLAQLNGKRSLTIDEAVELRNLKGA